MCVSLGIVWLKSVWCVWVCVYESAFDRVLAPTFGASRVTESNTVEHKHVNTNPITPNTVADLIKQGSALSFSEGAVVQQFHGSAIS